MGDLTLPISGSAAFLLILGVIGYFFREHWKEVWAERKKRREAMEELLTSHVKLCTEKAIEDAVLKRDVKHLHEKVDDLKKTITDRTDKIDELARDVKELANVIIAKRS